MAINREDGQFGLDCWLDPKRAAVDDADEELFSDNREELRTEALRLVKGGRYRLVVLSRWDAAKDEWMELEEFTAEDAT